MAGYMRKLNGYVYEGSYAAGEELANGVFVELVNVEGELVAKKLTAAKGPTLRVKERTLLWGEYAIVATVVEAGADEVFFVENEWEINDAQDYNEALYTVKAGHLVKMHQPVKNDELIMTVPEAVYNALAIGDLAQPAADGMIAKKG